MKKSMLMVLFLAVISPMVLLAGSTTYSYSATLNVKSSGNGKVYASTSSTTAGTSESATKNESSEEKSKSITLYAYAVADEGYEFSKWSDGTTGNPQAVSFSLTSSSPSATKNLTATFVKKALPEFSVTFSAPIGGGYTVNGTQVSSAYSLTQTEALETTLVADPSAGNRFYGWYTLNGNAKEYFSYSASVAKSFASSVTVGVDFISESEVVKVATFAEADAAMSSDAKIVEITSGTTLIVPSGSTLTVPAGKKLEVNGRLYVIGTLEVNGIVGGNGAVARAWKVITQAAEVKIPFPAGTDGVSGTDYGIHTVDGTAGKYLVTSVNDSSAVITDTSSFEEKYIVVVENKASGKIYYSEPSTSKPVGVLCTVAREKALNWIDGVSTTVYTDYATLLSAAATPAGAVISGNNHSFRDTNKLAVLTGAAGTVTYNAGDSSSDALGFAVDLAGTSITLTPSKQWNSYKLVRAFNGSFFVAEKVMNTNFSVYNCSGNLSYLGLNSAEYVTAAYLYDSPNIAVNFKDKKAESKGALWFCGGGIYTSKTPFNTTVTDKKSFNKVYAGTFDSKMDPREYLYDTNKVYAEQDPSQNNAWVVKTKVTDSHAGQVIVNGKESSLAEAIANAADNDVIKLQKDIVIDSELTVSASGVRIDLSGWKLSGDKSIVNNGDLEIIDVNGNGQIDVSIINNGTLLLSSAVYNGKIVLNRGFCYFLNGRFNGGVEVAADVANAADIAEIFGGTYALTSYTQGDNSHALVSLCKNGYLLDGAIAQISVSHVTSSSYASYSIDALNETERALYTRNAARESYTREEWIEFNKIKASCVMFSGWAIDCAIKFDRDIKANDLAITANISPIPIDVDVNIAANVFYSALLQAMRESGLATAPNTYGEILPNGKMEGQIKFALGNVSAQNGTLCHIEMRLADGVKNMSGPKDWSYTTFVVTASEKLVLGAGSNKAMIRPETGAATFYAKLADAVTASNGGTVLLAADSTEAETITLPAAGTYIIDPYGFAYANKTVVVAEGLELESALEIDSAYAASQQKAVVYTVIEKVQVQIGDSYFATLAAAIKAAKAGDTIKLLANVGTDAALVINKELTVDLNGKTIAATENDKVGDGVFCVIAGGELTINDSLGTGVIDGVGDNDYNIAIWANGGKAIINGGNFTNVGATDKTDPNAHFDLIYAKNGGEVIINGGSFECETPEFTLNSHDTYKGNITVNGGTFVGFDPRNNAAETSGTTFMAAGKYTFADGGNYIVVTPESYVLNGVASNSAVVDKIDAALAGAVKITKVDGAYVATAEYTFEITDVDVFNPEKSTYELKGGTLRPGRSVKVKYYDLATGETSYDKFDSDTVTFKLVID